MPFPDNVRSFSINVPYVPIISPSKSPTFFLQHHQIHRSIVKPLGASVILQVEPMVCNQNLLVEPADISYIYNPPVYGHPVVVFQPPLKLRPQCFFAVPFRGVPKKQPSSHFYAAKWTGPLVVSTTMIPKTDHRKISPRVF